MAASNMTNPVLKTAPIPSAILQQALEWQVSFWSGESGADEHQRFERWLSTGPQQQDAWRQVQAMNTRLNEIAGPSTAGALRIKRQQLVRRQTLKALLFISGSGLTLYGARHTPQWQALAADYHTGRGEQREITLPDGGRLTLNTDSVVDIAYDSGMRRIRLQRGEIHVATAADQQLPARPFIVETRQGRARAIGTRFTVKEEDGRSIVAVSQGLVELRPQDVDAILLVNAGERASFDRSSLSPLQKTPQGGEEWLRGLMMAERMPLRDFLANLGRYRSGIVRCDDSVGELAISGVFSIRDTDQTLTALTQILPIRITYVTRYWVSVSAR